jgi:MFS family permease
MISPAFRRLFAASATSNLADGIGRTALPLLAAAHTRSPLLISGLVTFAFLPWLLFALPSGALVDRVDRRHAMASANAVRALSAATLAVFVLTHSLGIAVLYAVAFALGVAETVYDSAVRAILPQVVDGAQLDRANSALTVEETLGQTFLGAPVGSLIFAAAAAAPFLLNAGGFGLAAVLVLGLRGTFRPTRSGARTSMRHDMRDGVRWLASHRLLRGLTLVSAATALVQSMTTGVLVLYVLEVLRLPPGDFGWFMVASGVGALLGGVVTPRFADRFGRAVALTAGAVISAVPVLLMGFTHNGVAAAGLAAVSSSGVMVWNVLTMSLRQALIPAELFGRVQGAYRTLVYGAIPIGSILGGLVARAFGLSTVFVVVGIGQLVLAGVLGVLLRRHRDQLSAQGVAQGALGGGDGRPAADELDGGLDLGGEEPVRSGALGPLP